MPKDLLLNDFDFVIADGDFMVAESTAQNQALLLVTNAGEWRESPTTGVGLSQFLNDETDGAALAAAVKTAFEQDGMLVNRVFATNNQTIQVDANY
jgi:hypothetical protein